MVIKSVSISVPRTVEVGKVATVRVDTSIDTSEIPSGYSRYRLIVDLVVDGRVYESKTEAISPIKCSYDVYFGWKPVEVGIHRVKAVAKIVVLPPPLPIEFLGQSVDVVRRATVIDERSSEEIEVRVVGPEVPTPFAGPRGAILWIDVPTEVPPGKRVSARVAVKNVGSEPGDFNVTIVIEGASYTKSVRLDPGEDRVIDVEFNAPSDPGTYTVITRIVNSFTGSIDDYRRIVMVVTEAPIKGGAEARPVAIIASVSAPKSVAAGEKAEITVKVANTGSTEFEGELRLVGVTGEVLGTAVVRVDPGKAVEEKLVFTAPRDPGTYVIYVQLVRTSDGAIIDTKTVTISVGAPTTPVSKPTVPRARIASVEAPKSVKPGERFEIRVTIENVGSEEFVGYLWIKRGSDIVYSAALRIPENEKKTVTAELKAPNEPGKYVYEIDVYNEYTASVDDSRNIEVVVGERGEAKKEGAEARRKAARIENVEYPRIVAAGARFEVKVEIVGVSPVARCIVEETLGNKVMDARYVVVASGERKAITLGCVAPIKPGRYEFRVILLDACSYEVIDEKRFEIEVSASRVTGERAVRSGAVEVAKRIAVPIGVLAGIAIAIELPRIARRAR